MEQLEVQVDAVTYRNPENGYSVIRAYRGRTEITVVGCLPYMAPGDQVRFSGEWTEHPRYGRQFKATQFELQLPTDLLGIERFLASGHISGLGPTIARAIVQCFGMETLTVLSEHPERLQEVKGIGRKTWRRIAESYLEKQNTMSQMIFLQGYGISSALAVKISRVYGDRTEAKIRENPYCLCEDIDGIGFQTADRIAISMGIEQDSAFRIRAALVYILKSAAMEAGHVYLPAEKLVDEASERLKLPFERCATELAALAMQHKVVLRQEKEIGERRVYLPWLDTAEKEVAHRLVELMAALQPDLHNDRDLDKEIDRFEKREHMQFSARQREAITEAIERGVLVITGGPGTGKTTIIKCILTLMGEDQVLLCAPTGRAAKRMSEATGCEARTIHRLLEFGGEEGVFNRNEEEPLEAGCVIVDETSMVDLVLFRGLLRAIEPGTRLVLVGDADQLPSVGAGNVLGDILNSGVVPAVRLTDIFRQSEKSRIVVNAHRINRGEMPIMNESGTDFFFERKDAIGESARTIVQLVTARLPAYLKLSGSDLAGKIMRSIQVLSPTRKGDCGVQVLNTALQGALNPPDPRRPSFLWSETTFRLGDKVMQIHNDYEQEWIRGTEEGKGVFNGDVGFITDLDPEGRTLTVTFDDDREADYGGDALNNLELAYCLSVHKSQGSEFPVVVMPVVPGPPMLQTRNLFYTALTRARSLVVLVGSEEIIARMVANNTILQRYTNLSGRIREVSALLRGV